MDNMGKNADSIYGVWNGLNMQRILTVQIDESGSTNAWDWLFNLNQSESYHFDTQWTQMLTWNLSITQYRKQWDLVLPRFYTETWQLYLLISLDKFAAQSLETSTPRSFMYCSNPWGSKSCDQTKWKCFDLHLGSIVLTWRQETCKTHVENIFFEM